MCGADPGSMREGTRVYRSRLGVLWIRWTGMMEWKGEVACEISLTAAF